jgi:hypothetical protein
MPKPPPRLRNFTGPGRFGEAQGQLEALALGLDDGLGAQVLGAGEEVEALEGEAGLADLGQQLGHLFGIDAELLGAAAHLHARTLELEVGVDRTATRAGQPVAWRMAASSATSRKDSMLIRMPAATAWRSSAWRLPGPAKLISWGRRRCRGRPAARRRRPRRCHRPAAMWLTTAGIGLAFIA